MENGRIDVATWPTDSYGHDAMDKRFLVWLHREAGVVKAIVEWS
jgi:hypothetical protein